MAAAKSTLRTTLRGLRDSIPPDEAARAAEVAAEHTLNAAIHDGLAMVAVYAAMRGELSTTPLVKALRARDINVAFPRVIPGQKRLVFHRINRLHELRPGHIGILEPPTDSPVVPIHAIDLFIVPGLAFDARGNRLGWGAAHYDVTLAENPRAIRVGFAFECQVVDVVPSTPTDLPMDLVITETRVRETGRGSQEEPR